MSNKQLETLNDFIQIRNYLAAGETIRATANAGIQAALADGQLTLEELAQKLGLDPQALELICEILTQLKILEKYDEHYALSQAARMIPEELWTKDLWSQTGKFLTDGFDQAELTTPVLQQDWMQTPAAIDTATVLDIGKSRRGMRVLELGCGSGIFGATFAHRDPDSTFVLVDKQANLERAKKTIQSIQVENQFEYFESADLTPPDHLGGFDLILLTGQFIDRPDDWCREKLGQIKSVMHLDGELAIVDLFAGQEKGELNLGIHKLQLALMHGFREWKDIAQSTELMKEFRFGKIQFAHLPSPPYYWGVLIGQFNP